MFSIVISVSCMSVAAPPSLEDVLALKDPFTDARLVRLYDEKVRTTKHLLEAALDDIWKMLPDPFVTDKYIPELTAKHLVWFVTLQSPKVDPREVAAKGSGGAVIATMLVHIGMPAIPSLLDQLAITTEDTKEDKAHREAVASCIVSIYERGGEGREMAALRIKLYASKKDDKTKALILKALDFNFLKPPTKPDEKPKK